MFDKVLYPVDFNNPDSWEKARPALRTLANDTREIHLLGIVHDHGATLLTPHLPVDHQDFPLEQMQAALDVFASEHFPDRSTVSCHAEHGNVAETIVKVAKEIQANLIVMIARPVNELRTILLGSNACSVTRNSPIPVLVLR